MHLRLAFLLLLLAYLQCTHACEPGQNQNGCKIYGSACICGYGCKTEYIYKSRRACLNVIRERTSNICSRMPCVRGICIQTVLDPGFTCKCEGTGFYGQRCERACPTDQSRGLAFPHECIVI
ncbi:unnamed protein product [Pieris brassicae]|uniref:EGF-like domain-containing protein n=2 Tax=Pieris brassicae TaxID=7116 RepID=A0A9P0U159_PIEBR|nr:unnamed protein product [Pieris brassicae]